MKRMRILGLCLVAVFALSATYVASASATDFFELGECLKVKTAKTGKFGNAGCTANTGEKANEYEWTVGVNKNKLFTSKMKSETKATLETTSGSKVTCNEEEGTGEFGAGTTVVKVTAHFHNNCETGGLKCNSTGKGPGEIDIFNLKGHAGILKTDPTTPIKDKMGGVLEPESGEFLAEFECTASVKIKVKGSLIVEEKAEKMLPKATLKFTAKGGIQNYTHFEGEPVNSHILESTFNGGATYEQSGQ